MKKIILAAFACLLSLPIIAQSPGQPVVQSVNKTAGREHFFPFFVDGDGFRSFLMLRNAAETSNECALQIQGQEQQGLNLDFGRVEANDALVASDAAGIIAFADSGASVTLATSGERAFAFGYATLDCRQPINARILLTLHGNNGGVKGRVEGTPIALTASGSAAAGAEFLFPLPQHAANFSMLFSNRGPGEANCSIDYGRASGAGSGGDEIVIPAMSTNIEFPGPPSPHPGVSAYSATCDTDVAALGIAYEGQAFSTLQPVPLGGNDSASADQIIPLIVDGGGFRSELHLANSSTAAALCAVSLYGADFDQSRFAVPQEVVDAASGLTLILDGGEHISFATRGEQSLALGYATVNCDEAIVASNVLSLDIGGRLAGMANIPGSQIARAFRFPVLPHIESLALVLSNDSSVAANCFMDLTDDAGIGYGAIVSPIEPQSTAVRLLEDLFFLPENFPGGNAMVSCDEPVAAIALPLSGTAFAALSPTLLAAEFFVPEPELIFNPADFPPILIYSLDEPIEPLQLPEPTAGEPPFTYSLEPEIPGLHFDPATRQLSGTPTEAGEFLSIYQARDAAGKSGFHPLFILVRGPDTAPGFADQGAPQDQMYTIGMEIEPLQFPEAAGGNKPLIYFLTPEVPGLTFDTETRRLRGTPTRTGVYELGYFVSDADFDMDSLEFTITVTVPASARAPLEGDSCTEGGFVEDPAGNPGLVSDCQALVGFANSLIDTGLIMDDNVMYQWGKEGQQKITGWSGLRTSNGRIASIELAFSNLKGNLPAVLGNFEALTRLDLRGNELSGPMPSEIGNLANLEALDLSANRLGGTIPAALAQLANLRKLSLEINELSGTIPPQLGMLGRLETLSLGENELSGAIPAELGQLANLRELNLSVNQLSGPIPAGLGQLRNLKQLQMYANELTGEIPAELGQLERLEQLTLAINQLGGAIPPELAKLLYLQDLNLSMNELSGGIPQELGDLSLLTNLDLRFNALEGSIPKELAALPNLLNLMVSFNQLQGSIDWAFHERIADGSLRLETAGNLITGLAPPPVREQTPAQPTANPVNASHHSIAYFQGPLVIEWDWQGERIEHQTPILGRWALLAVRIDHTTEEPPQVITRVLDAEDAVLSASLAEAAPPVTEAIEQGQWRSEFLFYLPGAMYQSGNKLEHVIDPENTLDETDESDNSAEPIALYGEQPPKFRAVFIPMLESGEEEWHRNLDPADLMAGTLAFMPIADDFEARFGPTLEFDPQSFDLPLIELFELWNAEADPDEFYHGIINGESGGAAILASQVAVSELSIHRVIPHEFGHNLGLPHTPGCYAEQVDENYPYPDGQLGPEPGWERNWRLFASSENEDYTDIMSYCTELKLISGYNYRLASEYWLAFGAQTSTSSVTTAPVSGGESFEQDEVIAGTPESALQHGVTGTASGIVTGTLGSSGAGSSQAASITANSASIAFSGRINASGGWSLTQAQRSSRQPRPPANNGEYTLILFDAAGVQIYAEPLSILPLSDGDESFWAARTPLPVREASEIVILDPQGNEVLRETLPELN